MNNIHVAETYFTRKTFLSGEMRLVRKERRYGG